MHDLKQRLLTIILLASLAALIYLSGSHKLYLATLILILSIAALEFAAMFKISKILALFSFYACLYLCYFQEAYICLSLISLSFWLLAAFSLITYPRVIISNWPLLLMNLMLVPAFFASIYLFSLNLLGLVCILVFSLDSFAYVFGKIFAGKKLIAKISPGKTWSGFFSGLMLSSLLAWFLIKYYWGLDYSWKLNLASAAAILAAVLGDLFESMLKRIVKIKDSSNLLPGHGGVLDRIDALLAALPIFALVMYLN